MSEGGGRKRRGGAVGRGRVDLRARLDEGRDDGVDAVRAADRVEVRARERSRAAATARMPASRSC